MYSFGSDYLEGALPEVMDALIATNGEQTPGYGADFYCARAAEKVKATFECPGAAVHFVAGGTQANQIAIASALRPHEAAVCAETGHINTHEAGAIEATGHKVLSLPGIEGKLTPDMAARILAQHADEHMVKPRLLYISNATELGAAYSRTELSALSDFCRANELILYIDGARLGAALVSEGSDLKPGDLARYADLFSVGGTKNGALFGEALVICNRALQADFRYHLKQRGALLAKGRLLGMQFDALFTGDLYFRAARHAVGQAQTIARALKTRGIPFYSTSPTNQIFPIFTAAQYGALSRDFGMERWETLSDGRIAARLVTSWATPDAAVQAIIEAIDSTKE